MSASWFGPTMPASFLMRTRSIRGSGIFNRSSMPTGGALPHRVCPTATPHALGGIDAERDKSYARVMALSPIFEFADRFVSEQSALDPCLATSRGIPGYDDVLTDFSPDGHESRANHTRLA